MSLIVFWCMWDCSLQERLFYIFIYLLFNCSRNQTHRFVSTEQMPCCWTRTPPTGTIIDTQCDVLCWICICRDLFLGLPRFLLSHAPLCGVRVLLVRGRNAASSFANFTLIILLCECFGFCIQCQRYLVYMSVNQRMLEYFDIYCMILCFAKLVLFSCAYRYLTRCSVSVGEPVTHRLQCVVCFKRSSVIMFCC